MTSCTATAPIDIPTNSSVNPIKGTFNCVYSPDMCSGASLTISNDRTYLSISCSSSGSAISFYGTQYIPSEIRIYAPSLHTYNGSKTDAEILIVHTKGSSSSSGSTSSDGLIVSVPVSLTSSGSGSDNVDLAAIIQASNTINVNTISVNPSVPMNYDVNANNFIQNKPFYVYYGTLPYDSCSGNYYYAVFTDVVSAAGPLSALVASNIASVQQSMRTNLQRSPTGPVTGANASSAETDDYVLFEVIGDCDDDAADDGRSGSNGSKPTVRTPKSSIGMNIVWGILIALVLLGISYMFLTSNDTASSVAPLPSAPIMASINEQ
jgi:carbonic anhydrase